MSITFKKPTVVKATYRIVTPMFIGGANKEAEDGVRAPSFKGALRFWWRALNWSHYQHSNPNSEPDALKALHQEEARLFGSAMDESKAVSGQGSFLLSIEKSKELAVSDARTVHDKFKECKTARYLAYGLMGAFGGDAGRLERGCINEGQTFTAKLIFRDSVDNSVIEALKAVGLLGALGSRARHGLGCIALDRMTGHGEDKKFEGPLNEKEYVTAVCDLLNGKNTSPAMPPFTAFCCDSRVDVLVKGKTPYDVLDSFSKEMLVYRSWGRGGEINNGPGEMLSSDKKFQDDHDWYRNKGLGLPSNFHPQRIVFGLPHNYSKKTHHVVPDGGGGESGEGRRASPLFFHVHCLGQTNFVGVAVYLPSTFLPNNININANGKSVPQNIDWSVITNLLDGKNNAGMDYFRNKTTILP